MKMMMTQKKKTRRNKKRVKKKKKRSLHCQERNSQDTAKSVRSVMKSVREPAPERVRQTMSEIDDGRRNRK